MFPPDIADWLSTTSTAVYTKHLAASASDTRKTLASLGVAKDSELAHLYLQYGPSAVRGWYELADADDIADCTEYAREELGVPKGFLALSSAEGEGVVLYEKTTGAVYDVRFGEFEQLASGALKPIAPTVVDYLRWCKSKSGDT